MDKVDQPVPPRPGALAGIRVVELGHLIAGPFCGHLFADHGAEVIKVEPPGVGDQLRYWGAQYKGAGLFWPLMGRGKRSVTLDLRVAEGQAALLELVRTADVLIENFRPGRMAEWGLDDETLLATNADLVVVHISGFGQTGPYRDRAAFGLIAEALSGFRHLTGEPGRVSVRTGISLADSLAGAYGFMGALMALLARRPGDDQDGPRGQVIDVALYEAMWAHMESLLPEYQKLGRIREPAGSRLNGITPSGTYPTSDGGWVVIGANQNTVFRRLAKVMGRQDWLAPESDYSSHVGRGQHQDEIDSEIANWTQTYGADELCVLLAAHHIPAAKIYTVADIATDAQYAARGMIVQVPEPSLDGELVAMQGVVPKMSATQNHVDRGAPRLGETSAEIWTSVLGAERFAKLQEAGVI